MLQSPLRLLFFSKAILLIFTNVKVSITHLEVKHKIFLVVGRFKAVMAAFIRCYRTVCDTSVVQINAVKIGK